LNKSNKQDLIGMKCKWNLSITNDCPD